MFKHGDILFDTEHNEIFEFTERDNFLVQNAPVGRLRLATEQEKIVGIE